MSETVTLYAVSDSLDDPHVVKATGRKTKEFYCIDECEGGSWPHDLRMKRESAFWQHDEQWIHFTPESAIEAYISIHQERVKETKATIAAAEKLLAQYAVRTNSNNGDGADDSECEVTTTS